MTQNKAKEYQISPVTLIHHAANRDHTYPAGSISAVRSCLESGAVAVEIDVLPIADNNFVLLHDLDLSETTNGAGNASPLHRSDFEHMRYKIHGQVTDERIGFLDEVIDLVTYNDSLEKLQLDLKPYTTLTPALIHRLLTLLKPILDRVQVSSVADWAVRALRYFSPDLSLGFDPLLYLDVIDSEPRPENVPPFRVGAYGLLDDHPLSAYQWGSKKDYFAARADALFAQAVPGCEWFIRAETLLAAQNCGFDWIAYLHNRNCKIDAWTLDPQVESIGLAKELVSLGVDEITTNDPLGLAAVMDCQVRM
ncbi:MAG: hypothetical protein MUO40_13295 [Anaerolineaceae bacterium]|nr:hypothetical protein [Anaerolineaceae bacterium]